MIEPSRNRGFFNRTGLVGTSRTTYRRPGRRVPLVAWWLRATPEPVSLLMGMDRHDAGRPQRRRRGPPLA